MGGFYLIIKINNKIGEFGFGSVLTLSKYIHMQIKN